MNKTVHFQQRQSQRGIKDEHICLAFLIGKKKWRQDHSRST